MSKGLRDNFGVVHIPSDGYEDGLGKDATDPWFALCEIEAQYDEENGAPCPTVTWTNNDVVDEEPNCMMCSVVDLDWLRKVIGG